MRRALIVEETFTPQLAFGLSEILRGVTRAAAAGRLRADGPEGRSDPARAGEPPGRPAPGDRPVGPGAVRGLHQLGRQPLGVQVAGLGRLRSHSGSRWSAGRASPRRPRDCEISTDVQGQEVTVTVERREMRGRSAAGADAGQVLTPDMTAEPLDADADRARASSGAISGATGSGSYIVNLRYRKAAPTGAARRPDADRRSTVSVLPRSSATCRTIRPSAEGGRQDHGRPGHSPLDMPTNPFEHAGLKFPQTHLPSAPLADAGVAGDVPAGRGGPAGGRGCARDPAAGHGLVAAARSRREADQTQCWITCRRPTPKHAGASSRAHGGHGARGDYEGALRTDTELPTIAAGTDGGRSGRPKPRKPNRRHRRSGHRRRQATTSINC